MSPEARRGDLFWLDWSPGRGSEQAGQRPALVVQTDAANCVERYTNTIVVAISTSGKPVPFHVRIQPDDGNGLRDVSFAKCEQIMTVSRDRLDGRLGCLSAADMNRVDYALCKVLGLARYRGGKE